MTDNPRLTITSYEFGFNRYPLDYKAVFRCPRCQSEYLHHAGVVVYDRGEDDELTAVTTVRNGLTASHLRYSNTVANPSSRRDGLAIEFWCEQCGDDIELTIEQHKGCTHLAWRYAPTGRKRQE